MTALILVLGDQLSPELPALRGADKVRDVVFMCEVAAEASYVWHHKKKLGFILAAMRAYADELVADGWTVDYIKLDDPANTGDLTGELARAVQRHAPDEVRCTEAGEHRVRALQQGWSAHLPCRVAITADTRFISTPEEFAAWADGRKQLRMEYFYREMRRKTGLLMDGDQPEGGRWNFDADNRQAAKADLFMPAPLRFEPSTRTGAVLDLVERRFPAHFGDLRPFWFAVTRADAERAAAHFLREALPRFGDFQDAMLQGEKFLFHSVLSPLINVGLLDPLQLCRRAEEEWRAGRAPLNAVEGFIRQIIGWREFVRGIYFREGPQYVSRNALGASRPLPSFYWTGETKMACLAAAIQQTREEAYAHHIQRLMITGNFALLAGIDPHELHEWYLAVYVDAFEWVEAPNTIGMSQFADGGLVGSKPYAASGAYINKMSDYCGSCFYRVKDKLGERACPFNALYWDFVARHSDRFAKNPRMAQIVRSWRTMPQETQDALLRQAAQFLGSLPSP